MAIKDANYVRTWRSVKEGSYTIDVGDSVLIKSVYCNGGSDDFLQLMIDKTTVGYFRIGGNRGNHLQFPSTVYDIENNVLAYLRQRGIFEGFPIGEGQTISWKSINGSIINVFMELTLADAGDYTPDMPNGSNAREYLYLNYGRPASAPTTAGDVLINTSLIPVEFPQFPFGAEVPAKSEIEVIGVCGSAVGRTSNSAANKARTTFLKFIKEREVLFDKQRNGLFFFGSCPGSDGVNFVGGNSLIGYNSTTDDKILYLFTEPLVFASGEELNVFITTEVVAGSMNLTAEDLEIALVLRYRKVE